MNEKEQKNEYTYDPDRSFYQTGSTRPKKSKSGLIAALLAAVIILGGIVTLLGFLNIRLFQKLDGTPAQKDPFLQFSPDNTTQQTQQQQEISSPTGAAQIPLQETPQSIPNVPQDGGLSLQEI